MSGQKWLLWSNNGEYYHVPEFNNKKNQHKTKRHQTTHCTNLYYDQFACIISTEAPKCTLTITWIYFQCSLCAPHKVTYTILQISSTIKRNYWWKKIKTFKNECVTADFTALDYSGHPGTRLANDLWQGQVEDLGLNSASLIHSFSRKQHT